MAGWNRSLWAAVAGCLLIGCAGADAGVTKEPSRGDACSPLPACDGDVVGTWQFDDMCPADREAGFDTLPLDCEQPRVRDVLRGTLTIAADGTFVLDYAQDESVTQIWSAKCVESTEETCKAREAPRLKFADEANCTFDGSTCTCVTTSRSTTKTDVAPYATGSLCAHADALRFTQLVPDVAPGNAPAPDRVIVHALHRVP